MASLNKAMLIGCLGKDPELRHTTSGTAVATFSLATSERYKNKAGAYEEKTEWHNIVCWGRLAEIAGEYLAKGKAVYIEGKMQTRKWQDKEGITRYMTEVIAEQLKLLSKKDSPGSAGYEADLRDAPAHDDDIPF